MAVCLVEVAGQVEEAAVAVGLEAEEGLEDLAAAGVVVAAQVAAGNEGCINN